MYELEQDLELDDFGLVTGSSSNTVVLGHSISWVNLLILRSLIYKLENGPPPLPACHQDKAPSKVLFQNVLMVVLFFQQSLYICHLYNSIIP